MSLQLSVASEVHGEIYPACKVEPIDRTKPLKGELVRVLRTEKPDLFRFRCGNPCYQLTEQTTFKSLAWDFDLDHLVCTRWSANYMEKMIDGLRKRTNMRLNPAKLTIFFIADASFGLMDVGLSVNVSDDMTIADVQHLVMLAALPPLWHVRGADLTYWAAVHPFIDRIDNDKWEEGDRLVFTP